METLQARISGFDRPKASQGTRPPLPLTHLGQHRMCREVLSLCLTRVGLFGEACPQVKCCLRPPLALTPTPVVCVWDNTVSYVRGHMGLIGCVLKGQLGAMRA